MADADKPLTSTLESRRPGPRTVSSRPLLSLCLLAGAWPGCAAAQLVASGDAAAQYEFNSNVYSLPAGASIGGVAASGGRQDSTLTYRAAVASTYEWSDQRLETSASGDRIQYQRSVQLDHDEYLLKGGLAFRAGPVVDGTVSVTAAHRMVPFLDLATAQLLLETDVKEVAGVNILVAPTWKVGGIVTHHVDDLPRPGEPNLALTENVRLCSITYLGSGHVTAGLQGQYADGSFAGAQAGDVTVYKQYTAQATTAYSVEGLSKFNGALGYTRRTFEPHAPAVSGVSGELGYKRSLTGKTEFTVDVSRTFNTYITTVGVSLDTRAAAGLGWSATPKLSVHATWSLTHSAYPSVQNTAATESRTDRYTSTEVALDYKVLRSWLLHTYAHFQDRSSTAAQFAFSGSIAGVSVAGHFQ
jgi:hypothetical protein